jgi:hypothetical protein
MKNYVEFKNGEIIVKAYTTLENIYEIENSGINLTKLFLDIVNSGNILSFTMARKILEIAIKADIPDFKERAEFVKSFFEKNKFKACDEVSAFVIEAVKTPVNEDVSNDFDEKK